MSENEHSSFEAEYNPKSFWEKVAESAKFAGATLIEKSLALHYCAGGPETPLWARTVIYGALGYFIFPIDAIPDALPVIGFTDDLGVLVAAVGAVATHMEEEHTDQAKETMKQWFG